MPKIARMPVALQHADNFSLFDDFHAFASGGTWTAATPGGGSASAAGAAGSVGGLLTLAASGGTPAATDEAYLSATNPTFLPAPGKPAYLEALVKFQDAGSGTANVAVGFASGVGAGLLLAAGAGLRTSGAVLALYKVAGETVWRFCTRNGTAFTVTPSTTPAGGAKAQRLTIEVVDTGMGVCTVVPLVDGLHLRDATNSPIIVRHQLDLTGLAAVAPFVGVRNSTTAGEAVALDYLGAVQPR